MAFKKEEITKILIEQAIEKDKLKDALRNILMNTIHRDFDGDFIYKNGVLGNIQMAVGKQQYDEWVELYT